MKNYLCICPSTLTFPVYSTLTRPGKIDSANGMLRASVAAASGGERIGSKDGATGAGGLIKNFNITPIPVFG